MIGQHPSKQPNTALSLVTRTGLNKTCCRGILFCEWGHGCCTSWKRHHLREWPFSHYGVSHDYYYDIVPTSLFVTVDNRKEFIACGFHLSKIYFKKNKTMPHLSHSMVTVSTLIVCNIKIFILHWFRSISLLVDTGNAANVDFDRKKQPMINIVDRTFFWVCFGRPLIRL